MVARFAVDPMAQDLPMLRLPRHLPICSITQAKVDELFADNMDKWNSSCETTRRAKMETKLQVASAFFEDIMIKAAGDIDTENVHKYQGRMALNFTVPSKTGRVITKPASKAEEYKLGLPVMDVANARYANWLTQLRRLLHLQGLLTKEENGTVDFNVLEQVADQWAAVAKAKGFGKPKFQGWLKEQGLTIKRFAISAASWGAS